MIQSLSKDALEFTCTGRLLPSIGSALKSGLFPSKTPLEKKKTLFIYNQLEMASGWGMGTCAQLSFQLQDAIWYRFTEALQMLPQSPWVHKCITNAMFRVLFRWYPTYPLALTLSLTGHFHAEEDCKICFYLVGRKNVIALINNCRKCIAWLVLIFLNRFFPDGIRVNLIYNNRSSILCHSK